ncbi:MAG TPA: TetR/AcrR family transcriptional regulator [Miltoncostaeaceae bacterium]|nr:TetR/AcrR family transcriptional regulator [Miltoncostaeaceae bacterium]
MSTQTARRRRSDGERSRRTILLTAARLATVEGLDGLTIGRLAAATGMSKSGLFAHFGSKEELQLATIGAAEEIFAEDVLRPALEAEGLERVRALSERFLSHVGRNVFPGGCFFASAAAELDTRPGPVRERVVAVQRQWMDLFEGAIRTAQERRELDPSVDPAQLTFELNALLGEANGLYLLSGDPGAFDMARRGIADRLERAAA